MTGAGSQTHRAWLVAAVVLAGCPTTPPPGDEQMGNYDFKAEWDAGDDDAGCRFAAAPQGAGFTFQASFSRFRDAGLAYITIGGVPHDAIFDGQRIVATYSAQRSFAECSACPGIDGGPPVLTMTETIAATLVSRSQSEAVEGCSETPPVDPDAGITPPGTTAEGGFDSVRACGSLSERVTITPPVVLDTPCDTGCCLACNRCTLGYTISGDRR